MSGTGWRDGRVWLCASQSVGVWFHSTTRCVAILPLLLLPLPSSRGSETRKVSERKYVPNVIEPSFGIGRIITGILEHCFSVREGDEQRAVLSFKPAIAPYKAVLLTLDARIHREPHVTGLAAAMTAGGLACTIDDSGASVGKRYARSDELGIPFAVTVDHQTAGDGCATVRERDTCAQLRVPLAAIAGLVRDLVEETTTWATLASRYPVVTTGEDKAAAAGADK